jgi:transposase
MKSNVKSNGKKVLEKIGVVLGVRSDSAARNEKRARQLTRRQRGKPIEMQTRLLVAMRLLVGRKGDTYRVIARQLGVSLGSISNIKQRIVQLPRGAKMPTIDEIVDALRDRKRTGGAAKKRKIGNDDGAHAAFLRELLEVHDARLQLSELCLLFERRFDVRVSKSTMHRFVRRQLGFSRQRVQRQLPKQAVTAKNLDWRKTYVGEWFVGADLNCVCASWILSCVKWKTIQTTTWTKTTNCCFSTDTCCDICNFCNFQPSTCSDSTLDSIEVFTLVDTLSTCRIARTRIAALADAGPRLARFASAAVCSRTDLF